jgi:hypothetical protein
MLATELNMTELLLNQERPFVSLYNFVDVGADAITGQKEDHYE